MGLFCYRHKWTAHIKVSPKSFACSKVSGNCWGYKAAIPSALVHSHLPVLMPNRARRAALPNTIVGRSRRCCFCSGRLRRTHILCFGGNICVLGPQREFLSRIVAVAHRHRRRWFEKSKRLSARERFYLGRLPTTASHCILVTILTHLVGLLDRIA